MKTISIISTLLILVGMVCGNGFAQNREGKWSFGFHGGANMWLNDFDEKKIGDQGELVIRYGITKYFSLGLVAGFGELKSKRTFAVSGQPFDYLRLDAFPAALVGWFHFSPGKTVSPYLYVGGGAMLYKRQYAGGYVEPNNTTRLSFLFPVGVGFEAFMSKKASFTADAGFNLIGDWLDRRKNSSPDGFVSVNVGFMFYFGGGDGDDNDKDGLTNGEERRLGTNPDVPDTDGDGLKDGEEVKRYKTNPLKPDTDGDGLTDGEEVFKYKTNPLKADTDEDGLSDGDEVQKYQTDPLKPDTDGDGLSDGDEVLRYHTNPLKVDTDDDGLSDWQEIKIYRSDPANPDTDGDGLTDGEEVLKYKTNPLKADTDGGGANDGIEVKRGTNPLDPSDDGVQGKMILEKGGTLVLEGVVFNSGNATLTPLSSKTLEKALAALSGNPEIRVEIAGYTDNVGGASANERLSLRRAEAVKAWFVTKGIAPTRLTTVGKGMKDPIADNSTSDGRTRNRRIELHIMK